MPLSIGVNLRVTGHCNQGGRKYMEDMFSVAFQPTSDDKDLEYAFFGIFDGHGGGEAATFAKEHLMDIIVKQKNFWSDRDEDVLRAIRDGYVNTHFAMWRELDKWPRTASGLPSTAGTTASIAFIRKGKIYIGHVGDSGIILGYQVDGDPQWRAKALTKDHKPESGPEMMRIQESGGKVVSKSGVPRVVWNRPRIGHKGPVRRSTHIDEIPFLAVARSLGDLWSYNSELNRFVVSPEPDVKVVAIDVKSHRCLIFGTDGLWNMLTSQAAVAIVQAADRHNEKHFIASQQTCNGADLHMWINPSKSLVDRALERWSSTRLRADNTSVVTLMLDPPGPSRSEVLLSQKERTAMNNEVRTPATSDPNESTEKSNLNPDSPSVSRPPPFADSNVDSKHPDSSGRIEEKKEVVTTKISEIEKSPEANVEMAEEQNNDLQHQSVSENPFGKSIQVPEISSSEMREESIENTEAKEPGMVPTDNAEKGNTVEMAVIETLEKEPNDIAADTPLKTDTKSQSPLELENTENKPKLATVTRQNAFSGTREESKSPTAMESSLKSNTGISSENNIFSENDKKSNILNGMRHKHTLFGTKSDVNIAKRRQHLNTHSQKTSSSETNPYVAMNLRFKSRSAKVSIPGNTIDEGVMSSTNKTNKTNSNSNIGTKRRHSAISHTIGAAIEETCIIQEPCVKRRTRSEDRPNPVDENDPANQTLEDSKSRLSWPTEATIARATGGGATTVPVQERHSSPNTFQRRSLGKKATPVKAIRRTSINGTSRLQQLRGSFGLRDWDQGRNNRSSGCNDRRLNRVVPLMGSTDSTTSPQRWLRSDTLAATPVKTLRSRNVDIAGHTISAQLVHQYGVAKQNRLPLPNKLKQSANNGSLQRSRVRSSSSLSSGTLKPASNNGGNGACSTINSNNTGCSTSSGMAKRVKSPYNPSARSLSTRSRIKRLGK